jgi:hypothetical protein
MDRPGAKHITRYTLEGRMLMFIKALWCLAAIPLCLGTTAPARANVLTFQFEGHLTSVNGPINGTFFTGEAYSVSFTFDSSAAPIRSDPSSATFPLLSADVHLGSYVATGVQSTFDGITVQNDAMSLVNTFDSWFARSLFSGPPVGGEVPGFGSIGLTDSITHTAFSSTALPSSLDLSKFDSTFFSFEFCDSVTDSGCLGGTAILGSIATVSVTPASVPWPPSLVALTIAALALVGITRVTRASSP